MANPKHVTLTASTVATVTLDAGYLNVEVMNVDGGGSAPIYFTTDGTTPVLTSGVGQDGCQVVAAAAGSVGIMETRAGLSATPTIKLISTGTPKVSVRAL